MQEELQGVGDPLLYIQMSGGAKQQRPKQLLSADIFIYPSYLMMIPLGSTFTVWTF